MDNPPPSKDQQDLTLLREGFVSGYIKADPGRMHSSEIEKLARRHFPDPPQPREITVCSVGYRVVDKRVQQRTIWEGLRETWECHMTIPNNPEVIRAIADLLERPHE